MAERGIALVTGGGRGIGAACCRALADSGFRVLVHYNRSGDQAQQLASTLGNESLAIQAELGTIEGMDSIYEALRRDFGGELAVLVNNAGMAKDNPLFTATLEEYQETLDVNLRSVWYLTKRLSRLMIRRKAGRIINLSSVVASMANPTQSVYAMTKGAIESFTRTVALELAEHGILVNAVAPGFIETDMTKDLPEEIRASVLGRVPLGRMGRPEEVAQVVRFLATEGSYVTGTVIHVNGGLYGG